MKTEYLINIIVALVSGTIVAIIGPLTKWIIEVKRDKRNEKKKIINDLKTLIRESDLREEKFLNSVEYLNIRHYLTEQFVDELENTNRTVIQQGIRVYYNSKFLKELLVIEKEWGLSFAKKKKSNEKITKKGWVFETSLGSIGKSLSKEK